MSITETRIFNNRASRVLEMFFLKRRRSIISFALFGSSIEINAPFFTYSLPSLPEEIHLACPNNPLCCLKFIMLFRTCNFLFVIEGFFLLVAIAKGRFYPFSACVASARTCVELFALLQCI